MKKPIVFILLFVFILSACGGNAALSDFGEWAVVVSPTCEGEGREVRTSTSSPTVFETRAVAARGHAWGEWQVESAATCLVAGVQFRVCTEDSTHIDYAPIAPLGHNYTDWQTLVPATCTTDGSEQSVCSYDNAHISTRAVPALGHDFGDFVTNNAATCTSLGMEISVCRNNHNHTNVRNIDAIGHDYNNWVVTKAPTCTEAGVESKICKNHFSHAETRAVDPIGHSFGNWVVIASPTESENGEEIRVCQNDKNHVERKVVPAIGSVDKLDFYFETAAANEYTVYLLDYEATDIYIPEYYNGLPVTKIGDNFFAFSQVERVTVLGSQLKTVGFGAFIGCAKLEQIVLPDSLERIEEYAFMGCEKMSSIIIPKNVSYIGFFAFSVFDIPNAPSFIHLKAGSSVASGFDSEWFESLSFVVVFDSDYEYGDEQPECFYLSYPSGEGGHVEKYAYQVVAAGGAGVTVKAVAYAGYRFSHWSDGVLTAERTDSDVTSDINVHAYFEKI